MIKFISAITISNAVMLFKLSLAAKSIERYDVLDSKNLEKKQIQKEDIEHIHPIHRNDEDIHNPLRRFKRRSTSPVSGCKGYDGKRVYIFTTDTKKALARCYLCGPGTNPDTAGVHGSRGDGFAVWTLEEVGDKCALKADTGKYAGLCSDCWEGGSGTYPDSVFVHLSSKNDPGATWTLENVEGGFAFKADTGKYMARCNNCVKQGVLPDFAFVYANKPDPWTIEEA